MKKIFTLIPGAALAMLMISCTDLPVSGYDLVWDTPSEDASGSMPIGNGEVGANVWVEPNGDLVFYISRTDSWSETGELYKLGRIRVSITPSIVSGDDFSQTLDLADFGSKSKCGSFLASGRHSSESEPTNSALPGRSAR